MLKMLKFLLTKYIIALINSFVMAAFGIPFRIERGMNEDPLSSQGAPKEASYTRFPA